MPIWELLVGGILLGGLYALMACGLNLIFGVMGVINFAHGDFLAIAALVTVSLVVGLGLPFIVAVVVVPLLLAAFGYVFQAVILRRIANGPVIMSVLATFAVSTIIVNGAILVWGGSYRGLPGVLGGSVDLFGLHLSQSRLVAFVVAMAGSLGVWWFLRRTRFGRAIRSVAQAPELATISGISIDRVRNVTFALGAGMAGLGGVLMAPTFAADPQLGSRFLIKAFAVIIVGGMGSYPGAMAGALLLGVLEVFGSYWFGPTIGSALLFLVMLATLLVRPQGLFGIGLRT
jgi:branched-chain amino acid transport system permease protein